MIYFKVKKEQVFIDGHGDADTGSIELSVTTIEELKKRFTGKYGKDYINFILLNEGKPFLDDPELRLTSDVDECEFYAEDGYNCELFDFTYKKISKDEYETLKNIIENYNKEIKTF